MREDPEFIRKHSVPGRAHRGCGRSTDTRGSALEGTARGTQNCPRRLCWGCRLCRPSAWYFYSDGSDGDVFFFRNNNRETRVAAGTGCSVRWPAFDDRHERRAIEVVGYRSGGVRCDGRGLRLCERRFDRATQRGRGRGDGNEAPTRKGERFHGNLLRRDEARTRFA